MSDGTADEAKGRAKEAAGDLTGDDELEREGKIDRAASTAKEKAGKAKEKVGDAVDKAKEKAKEMTGRKRSDS